MSDRIERKARSGAFLPPTAPNPTRRLHGAAIHPAPYSRGSSTVHPFGREVNRGILFIQTLNPTNPLGLKRKFAALVASLLLIAALGACNAGFAVSVSSWSVGSADVAGSITNRTGSGCTDPEVTIKFFDHNGARLSEFTFGTGELANGEARKWTTHIVGLFDVDRPVPNGAVSASASAACADQH